MRSEPVNGAAEDADEGDPRLPSLGEVAAYAAGAVWRHKVLFAFVALAGVAAATGWYRTKTPIYRCETRILAQRQQVLPSLVRPGVDEVPTRSAHETVHRRESLLALAEAAGLHVEGATIPPAFRWLPGMPRDLETDRLAVMVEVLDKKLEVETGDGTVTIAIDWPDPQQAYRIVDVALQNFLEARHLQEITAIDEVISVMQGRFAALREEYQAAVDENAREARARGSSLRRPPARTNPDEELERLRTMVEAKQRAIADVEEFRRRRLADSQAQLDANRGVYSDAHPSMVTLRQDVEALSRESPQVIVLREEERKLRQQYQARLAQVGARLQPLPEPVPTVIAQEPVESERLREARFRYQQMLERLTAAQTDLAAARAAFKYRYSVLWPPEVPRKPISPNPVKIFGGGGVAALVLALLVVVGLDVARGRVQAAWQLERRVGLPVLSRPAPR